MKNITRLSLALIMFSLFLISYLVTSVAAQDCKAGSHAVSKGELYYPCAPDYPGWEKDRDNTHDKRLANDGKSIDLDRDSRMDSGTNLGGANSFDDKLVGEPGSIQTDRSVKGKWEGGNTTKNAQGRAESGSAARTQQD